MARFERLALAAIGCLAIAACDAIAGLGQFQDVPCEACDAGLSDGESPDQVSAALGEGGGQGLVDAADAADASFSSTEDGGEPLDAADAAADAAGADVDASDGAPGGASDAGDASDADAGDGGSSPPLEAGPSIDWPLWVMPNGAEAGLPNPARYAYAPVPGTDGGIADLVTGLVWRNGYSLADASGACPYPWRVPSRIELVSILDTSQPTLSPTSILANPVFTSILRAATYGTATDGGIASGPWTVDFAHGTITPSFQATDVLCVRAADAGAP